MAGWDSYIERAKRFVAARQDRSAAGAAPKTAREASIEYFDDDTQLQHRKDMLDKTCRALRSGDPEWSDHLVAAYNVKPKPYEEPFKGGRWRNWLDRDRDGMADALKALWASNGSDDIVERVAAFDERIPPVARKRMSRGPILNLISVLLTQLDADRFPEYRPRAFDEAFTATGYGGPPRLANASKTYERALRFLDKFVGEATRRGLPLSTRLEAAKIVHALDSGRTQSGTRATPATTHSQRQKTELTNDPLAALADELRFDAKYLREIKDLLEDKRQVIFQGPPGTGKTYVAQKLAKCLAGLEDDEADSTAARRVQLVQFHPSYAYEDFVQGYRPKLIKDRPGFELKEGPLLKMAERASNEPEAKHFLVIDEINRGNLAKVFGELYFLLEYREEAMQLQYDDELFRLPNNLFVIGTMNTADRSIALVDLALRRRFHFVEFHPSVPPVKGLLRSWLAKKSPNMLWIADVVDLANTKLDDHQASIGPTYFMHKNPPLDDNWIRMTWKHNVLPYIEERFFGDRDRLAEFNLDKLRQEAQAAGSVGDGPDPEGGAPAAVGSGEQEDADE